MQIPMDITFRGMAANAAIAAAVSIRAARLEHVYDCIQRCDVVVEVPHHHQSRGREFHVRIVLAVPGAELVVSRDPGTDEAHEDVHVAIRDAFRAARRQLEDHVRRLRGDVKAHEGPEHGRVSYLDAEGEWGYIDALDGHRVYFHRNSVIGGIERIRLGAEVRFAEESGGAGPQATSVSLVGRHGHHEMPPDDAPREAEELEAGPRARFGGDRSADRVSGAQQSAGDVWPGDSVAGWDCIDEASWESFPASDPPAWSCGSRAS